MARGSNTLSTDCVYCPHVWLDILSDIARTVNIYRHESALNNVLARFRLGLTGSINARCPSRLAREIISSNMDELSSRPLHAGIIAACRPPRVLGRVPSSGSSSKGLSHHNQHGRFGGDARELGLQERRSLFESGQAGHVDDARGRDDPCRG